MNFWEEILNTFSNKKSFFSSKRIERCITFLTVLILTIIFIAINIKKLTAVDFTAVIGVLLVYGGYNTYQISKDKK